MGRSIALFLVLRALAFAQTGSVQGRVVDSEGAVVPRAGVQLGIKGSSTPLQTTITDDKGHFVFAELPAGTFQLRISVPGFSFYNRAIHVTDGERLGLLAIPLAVAPIVKCEPGPLGSPTISSQSINSGGAELYGSVVGMSGWFVPQVQVSLSPIARNSQPTTIVTGPDSSFSFTGIAPGIYTLRAARKGSSDFVIDRLELKAGERKDIIEPLEMLDCLGGFPCEPNRQVHELWLCL